MKETIKIEDKAELIGFLRGIGTECRFVTLDTETAVRMRKTGNPYNGTIKIAKRNGLVGVDFVKACERRYAKLHGLAVKDVEYEAGKVWYVHCQTEDGKPLALCQNKKDNTKKYLQYFPLRNLGTTIYVHPTLGQLTKEQVNDMYARFVPVDDREEWKPDVITLGIDSIRSITFRKIKMLNETVSRLVGRLEAWKNTRVDTRPAPVVALED
jgi:hypothetical protein